MNIFKKIKLTFFKAYDWSNLKQLFAPRNFSYTPIFVHPIHLKIQMYAKTLKLNFENDN